MPRTPIITYRKRPIRVVVQTESKQSTPDDPTTREPRLPHELDESAEKAKAKSPPDDRTAQGFADVETGLVDTESRQDARRTFETARRRTLRRRR